MKKKSKKVLMLGWEYPPHISGGLGVATAGLAESLKQYVDLQMVLPKELTNGQNKKSFPKPEDIIDAIADDLEHVASSPHAISGYSSYVKKKTVASKAISKKVKKKAQNIRKATGKKAGQELYGESLMERVGNYTKEALKIAQNSDFDIIHAHDWMTFPAAMNIQEKTGKPLVLHVHSLETDRTTNPHVQNPIYQIEREAIAKADLVIPVSDYTKHTIEQHYLPKTEKLKPIHNGISPFTLEGTKKDPLALFKPKKQDKKTKKKKSGKKEEYNILFVGRLTAQKGVDTFIRTAEKLLETRQNIKFVVAGLGDQLENMLDMAEKASIEKHIDFRGFVQHEELRDLLKDADLLFMPSVSEPFGLAALEAAQFALPIVISNQSGVIEVLPGVLTAEYWDSKTFARHINVLLDYKSIRKAFGKTNRKAVKKRSWNQVAEKVMKAYRSLDKK